MEFRRAFKRFKKDVWATVSAAFILAMILVAILAYPLAPDKTQYANQMHLSIHSQPPGFTCKLLIIPREQPIRDNNFFFGNLNANEEIPVQDIRWSDQAVAYKRFGNATDYFEEIPFNQFALGANREDIETHHLINKRFLLGTDKYGRDLLSRLIIGSRISISIGFVAVIISLFIGIFMGALAGFFGGWLDRIIMWVINVMWSIPTLLMVIAITLALGRGFLAGFCCCWPYHVG